MNDGAFFARVKSLRQRLVAKFADECLAPLERIVFNRAYFFPVIFLALP
jgi:hypothetical protein